MTGTKSREPLAATDVLRIFDDACIDRLAERLPAGANRKRFAEGIREAACIYAKDARTPTHSELHTEITALYRAAERKRYGQVAALLEKLSSKASELLNKRATRLSLELPTSDYLRDATTQQTASEAVLRLCQYGGQYIEVRKCLKLVGAGHADAVGLINELNRWRKEAERLACQKYRDGLSGPKTRTSAVAF